MLKWLVLLSIALCVTAQEDKGCCTPDQWEGYIGQLTGVSNAFRRARVVADGVKISYDFKNKRLAETVSLRMGKKNVSIGLIFDFTQKKVYRFLAAKKWCKVRDTKFQFKEFCIPDNATKLGSFYFGAGRTKLQVTSYNIRVPKMRAEAFIQVTSTGCIPVTETVIGARRFSKYITEMGFANITPGIRTPSVFNPPSYCQKSNELYEDGVEEEVEDFMVKYIHNRLLKF